MKTTPIFGISYPEASDHTRTWEHWQTQAEEVEAALHQPTFVGSIRAQVIVPTATAGQKPIPWSDITPVGTPAAVTLSSTGTTMTLLQAGVYRIYSRLTFEAGSDTGYVHNRLYVNGSLSVYDEGKSFLSSRTSVAYVVTDNFGAGAQIEVHAYHVSGPDRTISSDVRLHRVEITRVSP